MLLFMSYPFEINREEGLLNYLMEYSIDGYHDPETGEYFGDTYWQVTVTIEGGTSGGISGYAGESHSETIELGLGDSGTTQVLRIDFYAHNTFSAVSLSDSWTVRMAPGSHVGRTITGTNLKDVIIGGVADDILSAGGGLGLLDGGEGNDTLNGGEGNDVLDGGAGADTMRGGLGDDIYVVDNAGDQVIEADGEGTDHVFTTRNNYAAPVFVENVTLLGTGTAQARGNNLANVLTGNSGTNLLEGRAGDDILRGMGGDDILYGEDGNDRLEGEDGDDQLYGGAGHDVLDGGSGINLLQGGVGNDTYRVHNEQTSVVEFFDQGYDTVEVGAGLAAYALGFNIEALISMSSTSFQGIGNDLRNSLTGGSGNDRLEGHGDDDILRGGLGNDTLEGGIGADSMDGGRGIDTATYSKSSAGVDVRLLRAVQIGGEAAGDRLWSIENLTGSAHADTLAGNDGANTLIGGLGNDTLMGLGGKDLLIGGAGSDTMDGGDGTDTVSYQGSNAGVTVDLSTQTATGGHATGDVIANFENVIGSSHADTLTGNDLDNVLTGGSGNDTIRGGAGNDKIIGGTGADWMDGEGGLNTISYATSQSRVGVDLDRMIAWEGDASGDRLFNFRHAEGGAGGDTLSGDRFANNLIGNAGNDKLYGRAGNDTLRGGEGADIIDGGDGNDTVSYLGSKNGVVVLLGYMANGGDATGDTLISIENVRGSDANDYLGGDEGNNRLDGRGGSDFLSGNGGDDILTGGAGSDQFYFGFGFGSDMITDFKAGGDADILFIEMDGAITTFDEAMAFAQSSGSSNEHTLFDFGNGDVLTLLNVNIAELRATDFIFWWE